MDRLHQCAQALSLTLLISFLYQIPIFGQEPPSFDKNFSPDVIGPGSSSLLTFTITNSGGTPITDLAFIDNLPAGVVIATPGVPMTNCLDAALSASDGGGTITFSGGSLGAFSSCTISLYVTSSTPGTHTNLSGDLTSSEGNSGTASDDLMVSSELPVFTKSFAPSNINLGEVSTLTFTIDNTSNESGIANLTFVDNLPASLLIANPSSLSSDCGTAPVTPTIVANPGDNSISFQYFGTLSFPAVSGSGTCSVTLDVIATGVGVLNNISSDLQSDFTSAGFATASLTVNSSALHIQKSFIDDPVPAGGTGTLEFTITNFDRNFAATGISFTDDLNAALPGLIATGLPISVCGGTLSTSNGGMTVTFSGGSLAPEASCTFLVPVVVPSMASPGSYTNTTSAVTGTVGGAPVIGNMASAPLFVAPVPRLTKSFINDPVAPGSSVTLEFSITNTSMTDALTDINFTDELTSFLGLPLSVGLPPSPNPPCGPGSSLALIACCTGGQALSLTGGSIPAGGTCTFSMAIDIPSDQPGGAYLNTTSTVTGMVAGNLVTGVPASDVLNIVEGPRITKQFIPTSAHPGDIVELRFTIFMSDEEPITATNISFTDDLDDFITGATAILPPNPDPPCGAGSSPNRKYDEWVGHFCRWQP
ncbi:MAG: hypothetical protein IPL46_32610 [Saprospiraceae bacterium]|nr:hypothetical protein [Saprospiraceae bacterium]